MSETASIPAPEGTRDCGRFFLDVVGQYAPADVEVRWSDAPRATCPDLEAAIERAWRKELAAASQDGRLIYDGPLCRLVACRAGQRLTLDLGRTNFRDFLGTNGTQAYVRYLYGPEVLADPLGISAALRTADGFLLLGQRSCRVAQYGGRIHPLGGILVPPDDPAGPPPDPFAAIAAELHEEAALEPGNIRKILCIGMVRDKHSVQPELIFDAPVELDVVSLLRGAALADDAYEHSALVPVRDHPAAVVNFLEQYLAELTPVALATLLLHGLRHWGTGWFAAARGYLRSVI